MPESELARYVAELRARCETPGDAMMALVRELYALPRSLTGDGVRATLERLGEGLPLQQRELASGTAILDWTVPKEWQVRSARLLAPDGSIVADHSKHNLHLLGYSAPMQATLSLEELQPHLYSLPEQPECIPYRTSYYQERWGFCLEHRVRESLPPGDYRVEIDTQLFDGSMTWGEVVLPGETEQEVLVSAHICHPSLANDNLSGLVVTCFLARALASLPRRHTWRFLWAPGTVGAIAWLAQNEQGAARRIEHGLIAANLGDSGAFHYKRSRRGDAGIDRAVEQVLTANESGPSGPTGPSGKALFEDYSPFGYDERQYCSPGFDLPVGSLTRTPWGRYPEYHTSDDNLDFVEAEALAESLLVYLEVAAALDGGCYDSGCYDSGCYEGEPDTQRGRPDAASGARTSPSRDGTPVFRNLAPKGEPQLGRRGLYSTLGGGDDGRERQLALLWVLNQSDGTNSLGDIAKRAGIDETLLGEAADALLAAELLEPLS